MKCTIPIAVCLFVPIAVILAQDEAQLAGQAKGLKEPGVRARGAIHRSPQYEDELLRLGDPEILSEAVSKVLHSEPDSPDFVPVYERLLWAARPESISMLAPGMLIDEPFTVKPTGDTGAVFPKSYILPVGILDIIGDSPAFSEEVRAWARRNAGTDSREKLSMMRQWWKDNESFFRNKEYRSVRAGTDLRALEDAAIEDERARIQA